MRLEDLTIALRPRRPWEAVDLGCALVRRDYGRLLGLWAITVVPIWLILAAALWRHPAIFLGIAWWLKPLYDRVPLHFISSAAFGVRPSFRATLKLWPRLWSRFLLSALVFHRLSPIRSFALPVRMLEGQRGAAVGSRVKSLATDGYTPALQSTFVFSTLELIVVIGLFALTSQVAPESGIPNLLELLEGVDLESSISSGFEWYIAALYLVAMTVAEPFYVGAGFGLYINSRMKLEGWDIELTFRKLAARLRPAVALLVFLVPLLTALPARAVRLPDRSAVIPNRATGPKAFDPSKVNDDVPDAAKEILAKPEFEIHKGKRTVWVSTDTEPKDVGGFLAVIRILLGMLGWACVVVGIVFLVWLAYRNRHMFGFSLSRPQRAKPQGPRVVMGMDIARDSLPADLLAAARAAWAQGHPREALSLLYRGALSRLVEQRRLPIRDSDTEDDCLDHVAGSGEAGMTAYFRQLTRLWVRAAYAGNEAGGDEFENLCASWPFDRVGVKSGHGSRTVMLGLLPLILLPALAGCGGKTKQVEYSTGYKGPARSDPFLAAEELLQKFGNRAERVTVLNKMPDGRNNIIVLSGEAGMTEARSRQLLAWVSSGGHLVYALAGCKPYNDFAIFGGDDGYAYFGNEKRVDPLLEALNVTVTDRRVEEAEKEKAKKKRLKKHDEDTIQEPEDVPTLKSKITWKGQIYQLELPDFVTFKINRDLHTGDYSGGAPDKATVLSLRYGSGRVTLLNHARPFRNRYLADQDHARWLLAVVGPFANKVQFVLTIETSIWHLLWQKGWMPLVALGVVVLFWFWRYVPRFGPVRHAELHDTKHFSQHIGALGHFFHGLRRDDILLNAAANAVRTRALKRFPQLKGAGDGALLPLLAERSGIPEERIQTLLTPAVPSQPYQLVRLLQELQTLRQAVG